MNGKTKDILLGAATVAFPILLGLSCQNPNQEITDQKESGKVTEATESEFVTRQIEWDNGEVFTVKFKLSSRAGYTAIDGFVDAMEYIRKQFYSREYFCVRESLKNGMIVNFRNDNVPGYLIEGDGTYVFEEGLFASTNYPTNRKADIVGSACCYVFYNPNKSIAKSVSEMKTKRYPSVPELAAHEFRQKGVVR